MQIVMSAEEFEQRCLELIDEVYEKRITILITKNGLPFVQVIPVPTDDQDAFSSAESLDSSG